MNLLKHFVKPIGLFLVGSVAALALSTAQAVPITGSMSFGSTAVTLSSPGADLSTTTSLRMDFLMNTDTIASGNGPGDYVSIPNGTLFTPATLDLANLAGFNTASVAFGGFTAAAAVDGFTSQIIQQGSNFLDVFLIGDYSGLTGFDPTLTSMRLSFNKSGNSVSAAITLNSPPVPPAPISTPEPASIVLMGLGLAGLGVWRRRKA